MKILITASGFIGQNLVNYLDKFSNINLILLTTKDITANQSKKNKVILYKDFFNLNFNQILSNVDVIIHLISKQHLRRKADFEKYYKVNVKITEKLVFDALKNNVKQFIYISTIKVYGENSLINQIFNINSKTNPETNYSKTKLIAENMIIKSLKYKYKMDYIKIPLVYGKDAKVTSLLIKYIKLNLPLPFQDINNKRVY